MERMVQPTELPSQGKPPIHLKSTFYSLLTSQPTQPTTDIVSICWSNTPPGDQNHSIFCRYLATAALRTERERKRMGKKGREGGKSQNIFKWLKIRNDATSRYKTYLCLTKNIPQILLLQFKLHFHIFLIVFINTLTSRLHFVTSGYYIQFQLLRQIRRKTTEGSLLSFKGKTMDA